MLTLWSALVVLLCSPIWANTDLTSTTSAPLDDQESLLTFNPPDKSTYVMHSKTDVTINISSTLYDYAIYYREKGSSFYVGVKLDMRNRYLLAMIKVKKLTNVVYHRSKAFNLSYHMLWPLQIENEMNNANYLEEAEPVNLNGFLLLIDSIGYPSIELNLIELDDMNKTTVIHQQQYHIKIIRNYRTVDLGFTLTVTIVALMNTFAIGSLTDVAVLRAHVKDSVIPMCIAAGTQYIAVPLVSNY